MLSRPPSARITYMTAMVDLLREAGGQLSSGGMFERLRAGGHARAEDISFVQLSGETRFTKDVRFARLELVKAGLIDAGVPGQWVLSDIGWTTFLTVAEAQEIVSQRRRGVKAPAASRSNSGPTTGPRPSSFSALVSREIGNWASVYIFRFGSSMLWKIGHTQDVAKRLATVNRHIPFEFTEMKWELFARYRCLDSLEAYALEQTLLGALSEFRTEGERVRCERDEIVAVWRELIALVPRSG